MMRAVLSRAELVVPGRVGSQRTWRRITAGLVLIAPLFCDRPIEAQRPPAIRVFHVREPIGIRRTEYPVSVRIPFPKGALGAAARARVVWNGAEVPAQFLATATWDDGSVQALEIDFNVSLDPEEDRRFELQYGDGIGAAAFTGRGLTATDDTDTITVGSLRFSKRGVPVLASVGYRGENIGPGANGLTVTDGNGQRRDLTSANDGRLEVVKPGPLLVVLRYTATIRLADDVGVPVELLMEMPNSKTWLKTTATVADRTRRLRDIAIDRPYRFSGFPVVWDFGTDTGTYGVFRSEADTVLLTQTVSTSAPGGWKIEAGPAGQRRAIETSAASRNKTASGWGHLQDASAAMAFAVARFGRDPGTYTVTLAGSGQSTYRFVPAASSTQHQLVLYEHFVATPVAVGAATNPTAMMTPLSVSIER